MCNKARSNALSSITLKTPENEKYYMLIPGRFAICFLYQL